MDENWRIFQDSLTEAIMLLENPDMGGKNYSMAIIKLQDAYRKLPTFLSHLKELEIGIKTILSDLKNTRECDYVRRWDMEVVLGELLGIKSEDL